MLQRNASGSGIGGIGVSATLAEAVKLCGWRTTRQHDAWSRLGYLQLGIYSDDEVPDELPDLLHAADLSCVVHLLEINLMLDLGPQEQALRALLPKIETLAPAYIEEDVGLWRWGQTALEQHMLPPVFDDESLRTIAENVKDLRQRIGLPFYVENPPIYFEVGPIDVLTFMQRLAEEAECELVLDIGHLVGYCAATGRDPEEYVGEWTGIEHVHEVHVAGYTMLPDPAGVPMWYDDHAQPISGYALELVELVRRLSGRDLPITLEQQRATFGRIADHVGAVAGRFWR